MCFRYITCIIRVSDFCHVHLNALSSPCVSLIDVSPLGFSTVSGFEKKLVQVAGSKSRCKKTTWYSKSIQKIKVSEVSPKSFPSQVLPTHPTSSNLDDFFHLQGTSSPVNQQYQSHEAQGSVGRARNRTCHGPGKKRPKLSWQIAKKLMG